MMRRSATGPGGFARVAVAVALVGGVGCGGASAPEAAPAPAPTGVQVRDSAGVEIVTLAPAALEGLPVWRLSDEPVFSIGGGEPGGPNSILLPSDAVMLSDGGVVVTAPHEGEIRVYDNAGTLRGAPLSIRAPSPGFARGLQLHSTADDPVLAFEYPTSRDIYTIDPTEPAFTVETEGTIRCAARIRRDGRTSCPRVALFADGTQLYGWTASRSTQGVRGELRRTSPPTRFLVLDPEVSPLPFDSVSPPPTDLVSGLRPIEGSSGATVATGMEGLYEPGEVYAVGPSSVVIGERSTFALRVRGEDGALQRIIRVDTIPTPVTDALIREMHDTIPDPLRGDLTIDEYLGLFDTGATVPFFSAVLVDEASRIWLRDYQTPFSFGSWEAGSHLVLDERGRPLARIDLSRARAVMEIGEDYLILRDSPEPEQQFVRVYRLERG